MSTELREHIGLCLASLYEIAKCTQEIESVPQRKDGLATLVAVTERQLAAESAALKISQAELERVSAQLGPKQRLLDDLRARAEAQISEQINKANIEWWALAERVTKARDGIAAIDASFGSLRKRLNVAVAA